MTRIRSLLFLTLILIFLTGCSADGLYQVTLITGDQHTFSDDIQGDLVLLGGAAALDANAALAGNAHILNGSLQVDGTVTGDISFLNGELTLGPTARVSGDLNVGGGNYTADPGAVVTGRIYTGTGIRVPDLPERTGPDLLTRAIRGLITGVLAGLAAAFLSKRIPNTVARVGEAAIQHAIVSGAVGALVGLVGLSLLVTIAYTILLIPIALLGVFVMGMAVLYGWISFGTAGGQKLSQRLRNPLTPGRAAFIGALIFVWSLELLSAIPAVGAWIGLVVSMIGLGAVALTRFGIRRFEPEAERDDLF